MKLIHGALILLLSSCAMGQNSPTKATPSAQPKTANTATQPSAAAPKNDDKLKSAIAADTAVITVPNTCKPASKDCKTLVTRKQFESTLLGLSGGQPVAPDVPRRFASQYAEVLVFSQKAAERGMDKEPDTEAGIRYARLQVLATRYLRMLQEKSHPAEEEIQKYYESNSSQFQGVSLDRVVIPGSHGKSKKPEELKALAEEMRKRLAAGEDVSKLQEEVYSKLELKNPPETSKLIRQGDPEQESLGKLKVGEVSDVITDPMALLVFRSKGPKAMPLEMVKEEIRGQLYQQKLKAAIDEMMGDRKSILNDAYFGPEIPNNPHEQ
jgi:hypothetical protein